MIFIGAESKHRQSGVRWERTKSTDELDKHAKPGARGAFEQRLVAGTLAEPEAPAASSTAEPAAPLAHARALLSKSFTESIIRK